MIIIGHRGAAGLERENTISSLKKAEELGVDAVEIDLRLRRDGQIVVIHDPDPARLYSGVFTLSEMLAAIKIPVNLEVKERGFEKKLLETIKGFPSEVLISSFKPRVLRKFRTLDRNIKLGLIIAPKKKWDYLFVPIVLFFTFYLRLHSINPHYWLITKNRMWLMRKLNLKVFTWVINDLSLCEKMKALNVDGVVTDRPDLIKR